MRDLYQNLARSLLEAEVFDKFRQQLGYPADLIDLGVLQRVLLLSQDTEQAQETSLIDYLYPGEATARTDVAN